MGKVAALLVATGLESKGSVPLPTNSQNPGGHMGPLALAVYQAREDFYDGLKNVAHGYRAGYNTMAKRLRIELLSYADVRNGIGAALPSEATPEERLAIPAEI